MKPSQGGRRLGRWGLLAGSAVLGASAIEACSGSSNGGEPTEAGAPDVISIDMQDATVDAPAVDVSTNETGTTSIDGESDANGDASEAGASLEAGMAGCPTDGGIPDDLYCTGLYSDWATKTIAADAIAYTPALVFWSDGAVKSRWIYMPPGSKIDTTDMDNWVFPNGTKIWKQFVVDGALIETRLIWKMAGQWTFLDYLWSSDGTSAKRFDNGETNVNGTTYEVPSTSVCFQCHGGRTDDVLGFDLIGLGSPGAVGVTLATLAAQGRFTRAPSPLTVTIPEDATGKAAAALGWLHVNCGSSCHTVGGPATATGLFMKLLATELYPADGGTDGGTVPVNHLDTYTTAVNVPGMVMPNDVTYMRIAPADATHSLVPLMALARDPDAGGFKAMPPLVSHIPDVSGLALVNAWINALPDAGPADAGLPDGGL